MPRFMRTTIRSLFTWIGVTLIVLAALPTMAVVRLFDRDPAHYRTGRLFRWWGGLVAYLNPAWHLTVTGALPEDMRRPYVVVSNHQSFGDIPVICHLPGEMKWIVKAELFKAPVFGWLMKMAGDIPVNRRSAKSRAAVLPQARDYLDKRCSVMFFPEGTRSRDGRVLRFAQGPFRLAIEAGVPILPLAVEGTRGTLPKGGWRFDIDCDIQLQVLDPVSTDGLELDDVEALHDEVRTRIVGQIAEWRGVAPHLVDARAPEPDDDTEDQPNSAGNAASSPPANLSADGEKAVNTVPSEAKASRNA